MKDRSREIGLKPNFDEYAILSENRPKGLFSQEIARFLEIGHEMAYFWQSKGMVHDLLKMAKKGHFHSVT